MPGYSEGDGRKNLFRSRDVGLVHFVSCNTEVYFNCTGNGNGEVGVRTQHAWMKADLKAASDPAQRKRVPWIVAFGHRPMYCNVATVNDTCDGEQEQEQEQEQSRNVGQGGPGTTSGTGVPGDTMFAVEDLLHDYGVDVALYGHVLDYARFWPSYNNTVVNSTGRKGGSITAGEYKEPAATAHFTIGGAGNGEMSAMPVGSAKFDGNLRSSPWSAMESGPYGSCSDMNFGKATAFNSTHLYYEQYSVTARKAVDSEWIVQNEHGPFKTPRPT